MERASLSPGRSCRQRVRAAGAIIDHAQRCAERTENRASAQHLPHLLQRQHHGHPLHLVRPHKIPGIFSSGLLQYVAIEENERIERLCLCIRRHLVLDRQVRQERRPLWLGHLPRMAQAVEGMKRRTQKRHACSVRGLQLRGRSASRTCARNGGLGALVIHDARPASCNSFQHTIDRGRIQMRIVGKMRSIHRSATRQARSPWKGRQRARAGAALGSAARQLAGRRPLSANVVM